MERKHSLVEKQGTCVDKSNGGLNGALEFSADGRTASEELESMKKLLLADWGGRWGKPFTADELLIISNNAFETLFQTPPIGPIPEYLVPHWSVYGCVAEYEEKLDEIDRWKASQLSRWLKGRIGRKWHIAGKVVQLQLADGENAEPEKYRFRFVDS